MRTCTICGCSSYLLSSSFNLLAPDPRLSRVEHTLDLLIKSRHGNHRYAKKLGSQSTPARDVVPEEIPDLYPPPFTVPPSQKAWRSVIGGFRNLISASYEMCRDLIAPLVITLSSSSPSTLGRGSPNDQEARTSAPY